MQSRFWDTILLQLYTELDVPQYVVHHVKIWRSETASCVKYVQLSRSGGQNSPLFHSFHQLPEKVAVATFLRNNMLIYKS